jgi:hypothetical protein
MPRKTRKQKIIASIRRLQRQGQGMSFPSIASNQERTSRSSSVVQPAKIQKASSSQTLVAVEEPDTFPQGSEKAANIYPEESFVNPSQVRKDLVKTLVISLFAILSEGVLYWLWRVY